MENGDALRASMSDEHCLGTPSYDSEGRPCHSFLLTFWCAGLLLVLRRYACFERTEEVLLVFGVSQNGRGGVKSEVVHR